jgi:uncharacterized protein YjiS (DUF1127 family)
MHTINPERFSGWHRLQGWRHQAHLHHELMGLPDRYLKDIGISSRTVDFRPSDPFWLM